MLIDLILLTAMAGGAAVAGAWLARVEEIQPHWMEEEIRHAIMAFGGGALFAAIALVLVPKGMESQPAWLACASFAGGALAFMLLDRYFQQHGSAMSQLMAMMLDFAPESIVLGALITGYYNEAIFMAVIIAAQNFPEGFNAFREMTHTSRNMPPHRALYVIGACALTGPVWGFLGFTLFSPGSLLLGSLMTFCAGGILYLIFRDIAPQAVLKHHWYPSFGAVLGFMIGMAGHALI